MKNLLKIIVYALPLIALDQLTKFYVIEGEINGTIVPNLLKFDLKFNPGIALSLPLEGTAQIILIILILVGGGFYVRKNLDLNSTLNQFIVASILAGACGNLFDRFYQGAVIDFISVWNFPIFNLADVFIFYGICLLFYLELRGKKSL